MILSIRFSFAASLLCSFWASATPVWAHARFLENSAPFGNIHDTIEKTQRQGFQLGPKYLKDVRLKLSEIEADASLEHDGVEVLDLKEALSEMGVEASTCRVASHSTRMAIGQAVINVLEQRFDRQVIHLADTSRVSGGAIYGEATCRNTSSPVMRNAHHVFHIDKFWAGISKLLNSNGMSEGVKATSQAHWPLINDDFARLGYQLEDYKRLAESQNPGMLNLWVSLTDGEIEQQPIAVLMKNRSVAEGPLSEKDGIEDKISTMHVHFDKLNESITVLRAGLGLNRSLRWGFKPKMTFGQALLFYTDRTPHSAVWLEDAPMNTGRVSAELRVLVTDRPRNASRAC